MIKILPKLGLAALAAVSCAANPVAVERFDELPDFSPHEEFLLQANRKLAIMSEGFGTFVSGERFYYVAYVTRETIADTQSLPESAGPFSDPLWGEVQSLWKKRRKSLDPADYDFVIIDARAFPGTPGSMTRRVFYLSCKGHWREDHVASSVFEYLGDLRQ